ncbi:hypothetical protein TCON_2706 [Astathelohania contejeani]|uniref:Uncharacterized protein n=1 Tax=Astathelohania contejeani TaxID=164912 RepID=A0ABQ7HV92_9MICR|nr:hypothetical protein TCON_2706 [Thelohania contejeani]
MKYGNIDPRAEGFYCYIQDRNVFWRDIALQCQHCGKAKKSIDHLATGYDRMFGNDYTQKHNEVLRYIHLLLANKYGFKKSKNHDGIQSRRSWKMKEPILGLIQG